MRRSSQASGWICSSTRPASSRRCATVRSSGTPFARQRSSMRPEPRAEGHRWLAQAENDLRFAELASQERFFAQACFNSQQAAEKALERSEERRVGKEGRCRWTPDKAKKKDETDEQ